MNTDTQSKGNLSLAQVKRLMAACAISQAKVYGSKCRLSGNSKQTLRSTVDTTIVKAYSKQHKDKHMSRSEYEANKQLAAVPVGTKAVKEAPAGYITGPVIRSESEKPEVKQGDINDPSTWALV